MNTTLYDFSKKRNEWDEELKEDSLDALSPDHPFNAKKIYSTRDYYFIGWQVARHGILILDFQGKIVDANPFFCEQMDFQKSELIGKKVSDFCVRADDLYGSDSINILTLLQSTNQQQISKCNLETKENKLFRCRWVANRIPADLTYPFSHSLVYVYFLSEINYSNLLNQVKKIEKKESNPLYRFLDSVWIKILFLTIVILSALGGKLPDLIEHIIKLF
jgi:hypothetical protein